MGRRNEKQKEKMEEGRGEEEEKWGEKVFRFR